MNRHDDLPNAKEIRKFQREFLKDKLIKYLNKSTDELEWELDKAKTIIRSYEVKTPEMMKEFHRDKEMSKLREEKNRLKKENERLLLKLIRLENAIGK